jgi:O-succinylbenzoic acid--CoA ligase
VLLGARQLDSAARAANACLHLEAGDRWLNCLPLYHIGGQSILWRCARAAACVVLHDGFVAEAVARDLDACSITHLSLVPAMLARLLDLGCRPPPTLRAVLIGGAALSRPLYDRATAAGWPLHVSYGMSETAAQVATFTPNDGAWHEAWSAALPGHEIRIGDDGRIRIRGPQVMLGYLDGSGSMPRLADHRRPRCNRRRWPPDGARPRRRHADQRRPQHPPAGNRILPRRLPRRRRCRRYRPARPGVGDLVVALVVGSIDHAHLLDHARRLPSAALPRRIRQLDSLPRNAAGKLERAALRRRQPEPPA